MRNNRWPRSPQATPCQDVLKAFLAQRRVGGLFFHCQLAKHLTRAGFDVRRVEKQDNHAEVWVLKVRRGWVPVGLEIEWVKKQVCLFLKRHGLRYPKRDVVAMVEGERITAGFNWAPGSPGWMSFERAKAGRRTGTQSGSAPASR